MPGKHESYYGHLFSVACIIASAALSFRGAWLSAAGAEWISLVVITCVAEPSKYFTNRVLWVAKRVRWWQRAAALTWYLLCIGASVALMQLPMLRSIVTQETAQAEEIARQAAQEKRREADLAELKERHREVEAALEDARTARVPNLRPSTQLRQELKAQLSTRDRQLLERELNAAQLNDQLDGKVARLAERSEELQKAIGKASGERSRAFTGRPVNVRVSSVPDVHERLNALSIAAAILLELAIAGGIWSDTLYNRGEAAPPAPAVPEKPVGTRQNDGAKRFETYLAKEWRARRCKDGWLEGTQQGWARAGGFSAGFVHAQLMRLEKAGRIEKRADHRNTWVRFVKTGELKIAT